MKSKLLFIILLFINLIFTSSIFAESFDSWKRLDSFYKKNNINIFNLTKSQIKELKLINFIPTDFSEIQDVKKKKKIFYLIAYPLIYENNLDIKIERDLIIEKEKKFKRKKINENDLIELRSIAKKYKIDSKTIDRELFKKLKQRINVIPMSLALGQAIIESGWGQSRFAIEGNALYGQWTFNQQEGLIPKNRDPDKNHVVKKFTNLKESVRSYMYNINTNPAYYDFRVVRRITSALGLTKTATNYKIQFLAAYSEMGKEYVDKLELIIESNNLKNFDRFN